MGIWTDHLLPRATDRVCASPELGRWRVEATAGLTGTVLEVGFGSGLNIGHYPPEVGRVLAVEPSAVAWRLAQRRIAASPVEFVHAGFDGRSIALDDASCDSALCTFTLCTVPDVALAVAEIRRILQPGGRLHLLEHGLAPDPGVARWQRRLDPIQRRTAGGCHLTRQPLRLVADGGFRVESSREAFARGPKPWSYFTIAVAARS